MVQRHLDNTFTGIMLFLTLEIVMSEQRLEGGTII